MRVIAILTTLFFQAVSFAPNLTSTESRIGTLVIELRNIDVTEGCLRLAVYRNAMNFLKDEGNVLGKIITVKELKEEQITLSNLDFGDYALAAYHDINNNGRLDTNLLGIPTEPYAFSNNVKAKWRNPRFEEACFAFNRSRQVMPLVFKRWGRR